MDFEQEQKIVAEIKRYVSENLPLSQIEDAELEEQIEAIVAEKLQGMYCPIDQRVSIVQQVYSSIRGFGLLDSIISDDTITEVMINGPENVFIEQNGRLFKMDKQFERYTDHPCTYSGAGWMCVGYLDGQLRRLQLSV